MCPDQPATTSRPLYLSDARFIDAESLEIRDGHFLVERGAGGDVRPIESIPRAAERVECGGRIVTRSFVVGHHHIYSCLARGMPPPRVSPTSFVEILEYIWWNLDRKLDTEMIRSSALAAGAEAARCGTTMIVDHHSSPSAAEGSLGVIAESLEEVGLSHLLCIELSDRDGAEAREAGLRETRSHLGSHQGLVGLHASFTVSDDLLGEAVDLAREHGTGIHIHVAEAESDQEHCLAKHGTRCVHRLAQPGALDLPQTILAHCIHLDASEREALGASRAWISQQVESNLNNNVGIPSGRGFEGHVILGTDGMNGDCLQAARATYLACQATDSPSPLDAYRRVRRVHRYLASNEFAGDSGNNLVILDYHPPTEVSSENWPAHVVYALNRSHVHTVISDGRVIVEDGRCTLVDEDEILARAREEATRLWRAL